MQKISADLGLSALLEDDPFKFMNDHGVPPWVAGALVVLIVAGFFVKQLKALEPLVGMVEKVFGVVRRADHRREVRLRQKFAEYLESRIRLLNSQEEWSDTRFAELEAEVEFEGASRSRLLRIRRDGGVRRERSLSRALKRSAADLIILQGDPGSGKSVALRHLAFAMAKRAEKSHRLSSVLPVYVNLRDWKVSTGVTVDAAEVRRFVIESLTKINDRDVANYVAEHFEQGLEDGTWFFLFDSFDEIPEILSSSEEDASLQRYREALYNFLHGLHKCRGIVASREFRGPSTYGLTTFRIAALSAKRRVELVQKAELKYDQRRSILATLPTADEAIQQLAGNPMFLGLLCEHIRDGNDFPTNSYSVFETYISKRLDRDSSAVEQRFGITAPEVRAIAENIAFTMSVDPTVGLSPTVAQLTTAIESRGSTGNLVAGLSALAYTKLITSDQSQQDLSVRQIAFSHRRFQEYFATCVVLRDLNQVSPTKLLKDARWRETAVTIFQTQPTEVVRPLISTAIRVLNTHLKSLPTDRVWSPGILHVLGILDAGIVRHDAEAARVEERVDAVLQHAVDNGTLLDQKWAVDVSGAASERFRLSLFRMVFKGESEWLRAAAYRQLGRLHHLPGDMADAVRKTLLTMTQRGRLRREHLTVDAQLRRLSEPRELLRVFRLLRFVPAIDFGLCLIGVVTLFGLHFRTSIFLALSAYVLHSPSYMLRYLSTFSWSRFAILSDRRSLVVLDQAMDWLFYLMVRTAALATLVLPALSVWSSPDDLAAAIHRPNVLLISAFVLLWSPGALVAARTGEFTKPRWWPFYPLLIVVTAVLRGARGVGGLSWRPRKLSREVVRALLILGGGVLLLVVVSVVGAKVIVAFHWETPVVIAGGVVVGLCCIGLAAFATTQKMHDVFLFRRLADMTTTTSPELFRRRLNLFSQESGRLKYIRLVRRRQLLASTGDVVLALSRIVGDSWTSQVRDELAQLTEELSRARPGGLVG
jgi:hypothetical protein